MKKFILAVMVFALLVCSACSNTSKTEKAADGGPQPAGQPASQPPSQTSSQVSKGQPSDEEITALYKKAVEAYGWFDLCSIQLTYNDTKTVDGQQYSKVDYPGISTLAQLRAYLNTLFSPEVTEQLLSAKDGIMRYRDIDGVLYGIDAARGSNISHGDERYTIIRQSDTSIDFHVDVDVLDTSDTSAPVEKWPVTGTKSFDFILKPINGSWVFANFELTR
jgi:hypothetical protein